jgi:hypothetical protein
MGMCPRKPPGTVDGPAPTRAISACHVTRSTLHGVGPMATLGISGHPLIAIAQQLATIKVEQRSLGVYNALVSVGGST